MLPSLHHSPNRKPRLYLSGGSVQGSVYMHSLRCSNTPLPLFMRNKCPIMDPHCLVLLCIYGLSRFFDWTNLMEQHIKSSTQNMLLLFLSIMAPMATIPGWRDSELTAVLLLKGSSLIMKGFFPPALKVVRVSGILKKAPLRSPLRPCFRAIQVTF